MATLSAQPRFLRSITLQRAAQFISDQPFGDVNLSAHLYSHRSTEAITHLSVYSVPDLKRISFKEAVASNEYRPTRVGAQFGPTWSTHWFKLSIDVPKEWAGQAIELLWDANCEAMVWSMDGIPLQGLTGDGGDTRRIEYSLTKKAKGGEQINLMIEIACNGLFGAGRNGVLIGPTDENRYFQLSKVEIAIPNTDAWHLFWDIQVISGMANELPSDNARGQEALYVCNQILDSFSRENVEASLKKCLQIAKDFLAKEASSTSHLVTAVGNCHIDTCWLWPYAETRRKTARSWSSQLRLIEEYPEYVFVASQAQQFEWLRQDYPELFQQIQKATKTGQFQPIGSTWVEMDCNMPSGEALCRQFMYGQRFYKEHFGAYSRIFWLPDTFGYSAQLPQIMTQAGCKYFFTQKLSWNNINKFPNTTFIWVGLDGTKVLTHMAPVETYTANATVNDLVKSERNHHDLAFSNASLLPYGNGDGGGGPLRSMIERLRRMRNTDGLPRCEMNGVETFYDNIAKNATGLQEWKGELYFELHRGTYTSQARTKWYNRKLEFLLREIEIVATACIGAGRNYCYPKTELDELWKNVLLNQHHDGLPGSSIELANKNIRAIYRDVEKKGKRLLREALDCLQQSDKEVSLQEPAFTVFNSLGWPRTEIIEVPQTDSFDCLQYSDDGKTGYAYVEDAVAFGFKRVVSHERELLQSVQGYSQNDNIILENKLVKATFNRQGHLISFYDKHEDRELVPQGLAGNVLVLFEDIPLYWDAWDVEIYHLNTRRDIRSSSAVLKQVGPLQAAIEIEYEISSTSFAREVVTLNAVSPRLDFSLSVDWDENRTMLKVEFPWDIRSDFATYDTQFGVMQRTTTFNTSADFSKFEVCGHKFADLSEHGYGVALLNDCKYGYSCHGNVMRLSLLRSPKSPDAHCDIGHHEIKFAAYPHKGTFHESRVVQEAFQFNVPLVVSTISYAQAISLDSTSFFSILGAKNVILDTVKRAEDSQDIIVRLYEAYGGRAVFQLSSTLTIENVRRCDILERDGEPVKFITHEGATERIVLNAFEIVTLKMTIKGW
ncbi:Glycoside hydrolase, 38 vacuolar alpha mannosidase [Actinomortierella wolfii]|nr:Glycoside hydrolase, 38 vacuolar alpha mannosidase [Actinomortierella wolfii]